MVGMPTYHASRAKGNEWGRKIGYDRGEIDQCFKVELQGCGTTYTVDAKKARSITDNARRKTTKAATTERPEKRTKATPPRPGNRRTQVKAKGDEKSEKTSTRDPGESEPVKKKKEIKDGS